MRREGGRESERRRIQGGRSGCARSARPSNEGNVRVIRVIWLRAGNLWGSHRVIFAGGGVSGALSSRLGVSARHTSHAQAFRMHHRKEVRAHAHCSAYISPFSRPLPCHGALQCAIARLTRTMALGGYQEGLRRSAPRRAAHRTSVQAWCRAGAASHAHNSAAVAAASYMWQQKPLSYAH